MDDLSSEISKYIHERRRLSNEEIEQGHVIIQKHLVARFPMYKIEIRGREHPPPHFHLNGPDLSASFAIEDLEPQSGEIGKRHRKILERWYHKDGGREKLINVWNETRPEDCPVGPIQ